MLHRASLVSVLAASAVAASAQAALVTFTGGTVTMSDTSTNVTNTTTTYSPAAYYDEDGFRFSFLGGPGYVGTYYGVGNDVIHAHWATGPFGTVTSMTITQIGGGGFDLNYFNLTSNTDTGGSAASGFEQTWVRGYFGGNPTGPAMLLPVENWGFPPRV